MTRYLIRPATTPTVRYDVYDDNGTLAGTIARDGEWWRFKPKKSDATISAPSLPALRILMRDHAAQEATTS